MMETEHEILAFLELRMAKAATPTRVVLASRLLERVLLAANEQAADGDVTLVVNNYATKARINARTSAGVEALALFERVLADPPSAAVENERAIGIMTALVEHSSRLLADEPSFFRKRERKPFRRLDIVFYRALKGIVTGYMPSVAVRGYTTIYSTIYRVGRTMDDKAVKIRIRCGDAFPELEVQQGREAMFFDLAKRGKPVPIRIDASWSATEDGHRLDFRRSRAIGVDKSHPQASGSETLDALRSLAGDAFQDMESVTELLGIERERH